MALLLSLIGYDRLWPTFGGIWSSAPSAEVEVGPLLQDRWGDVDDGYSPHGLGLLTRVHPKSVDRGYLDRHWLLNELLSLGRYDEDRYPSNIEAYLLNVDGDGQNQRVGGVSGGVGGGDEDEDDQRQTCGGPVIKTELKKEYDDDDGDVAAAAPEGRGNDVDQASFDTDIVDDVFMLAPEVSPFPFVHYLISHNTAAI